MHNSADNQIGQGGVPEEGEEFGYPLPATASGQLLKGTDASSTCLNCHAGGGGGYHVFSTNASNWSPGGDFFWLTQSYTNSNWSGSVTSEPDQMGHNIIAKDYGLTVDDTNTNAPGGTYPSNSLGCVSCHDPHGQVMGGTANGQKPISVSGSYGDAPVGDTIAGNYRLLGDINYDVITAAAPIAVISVTDKYGETDASHVAYGTGMSEWCGSCHGEYLVTDKLLKHPTSVSLGGTIATTYGAYVATGDYTGVAATSYTALVPFEHNETDKLLLDPEDTSGPVADDQVMCLTCHRAHASAFTNITRWDMEHELLAESWPTAANLTAMGAIDDSAYYGRDIAADFGDFQRSLCNKCHVKD
jgi:predicted CXXCH cytochrome family protein